MGFFCFVFLQEGSTRLSTDKIARTEPARWLRCSADDSVEFVGLISVIFNLKRFFLWNPGVLRDFWNWESLRWAEAQCPQLFHRKPPPEAWNRDYSTNLSWNEMGIIMFLNRYNRIKLAKQDINTYPLDRQFKYVIFAVLSLEFLSLSLSEEKKNNSQTTADMSRHWRGWINFHSFIFVSTHWHNVFMP